MNDTVLSALTFAVLELAVIEAQYTDHSKRARAQMWLASKDAEPFCDAFGIDPRWIRRWAKNIQPGARRIPRQRARYNERR